MDRDTWKVAFAQQLVQFGRAEGALHEDDYLVEFECVEEVVKLSILLSFTEFDVVLLESVKRELRLIVDVDFQRILHEFLADRPNLLR